MYCPCCSRIFARPVHCTTQERNGVSSYSLYREREREGSRLFTQAHHIAVILRPEVTQSPLRNRHLHYIRALYSRTIFISQWHTPSATNMLIIIRSRDSCVNIIFAGKRARLPVRMGSDIQNIIVATLRSLIKTAAALNILRRFIKLQLVSFKTLVIKLLATLRARNDDQKLHGAVVDSETIKVVRKPDWFPQKKVHFFFQRKRKKTFSLLCNNNN